MHSEEFYLHYSRKNECSILLLLVRNEIPNALGALGVINVNRIEFPNAPFISWFLSSHRAENNP